MKNITVFLVSSLVLSLMDGSAPSDQLSLLAFKDGVTQDPLGALSSWNSSLHFCNWNGVTCDRQNQRVTILNLQSQSLFGTLTPHIGNLTSLTDINLENNSFYGQLPHELGRLSQLRALLLSNNSFEGQIPADISHCSNLEDLHLSSNKLVGNIPPELGLLSKLVILGFRLNSLTGRIPPSLGNMSSLQHLTLNFNNLEGSIPDSIGHMRSLKYIRIGKNRLSGTIPSSIWNHSSLIELYVAYNQLHGVIPQDIGFTLPNLQNFGIAGNNFSGSIPDSISNISSLDYIDIGENNFVGPVTANLGALKLLQRVKFSGNPLGTGNENDLNFLTPLINCSRLKFLSLQDNGFRGVLPDSIANLSIKLHTLELGRNEIYGSIPMGIENLINLTQLSMERNLITGTIPYSIGKLRKLKRLNLNGNKLLGEIPSSIGNMLELYELHLQDNNLSGCIPLSFKSFQRLQILDLSQNGLNGTLPGEVVGPSTFLTHLNISHNSITGPLPAEVGSLKNLEVLDISKNSMSGEIPSALGKCWKLEQLYMEGNAIDGDLQPLEKLKTIEYLDISGNKLSGQVPKEFQDFPFLQSLNLSFNDLQGELPIGGVFRNSSAISVAGNVKLCGGIPELTLPACLRKDSQENGMSLPLKIMVPTVVVLISLTLIAVSLILYWRRKPTKRPSPAAVVGDCYSRISYEELLKATNGFKPTNLIGIGSFGSVYKGFLQEDETPVAIKVLNLQQKGASSSFMAECNALKNIRHRNLLKLLTSCSSMDFKGNSFKALVYKFMSNGSLEDWLHPCVDARQQKAKILSFGKRLNIALDVALALDYLHHYCDTPIVHCDLKPSNILLDDDLTAHVGDFGLVKLLSTTPNNLRIDEASFVVIRGSIGYVPPEYGAGGKVSTSGDVYSYGILLLEMFTGRRPTDEMFKDTLSLHNFSKMALPDRVVEIADAQMFCEEECDEANINIEIRRDATRMVQKCMLPIFRIGVACSAESQVDRMDIKDVIAELSSIRDLYQGTGIHGLRNSAIKYMIDLKSEYGMGDQVSRLGEVYSYGILLWEMVTGKKPTEDMFKDGLNLHNFAAMALPDRIMEL